MKQIKQTGLEMCLNQMCRPKIHVPLEGVGDCTICEYDPLENVKCRQYTPIYVNIVDLTKYSQE